MKRTLLSLLLAVTLLFSLPMTVFAAERDFVIDEADLLTDSEEQSLSETAAALAEAYGMDIVILTNESLGGKTPEQYADDYYDSHGYDDNGILYLLSMEERDWYISTCGTGILALTDYGIQKVGEGMLTYLGQGKYYKAFEKYLSSLDFYLESYQKGSPIDGRADTSGDYYTGTREKVVHYKDRSFGNLLFRALWQSLILGIAAAAVTVAIMRSTMNTKKKQPAASAYLKEGSFRVRQHRDLFLYSRVTKTRRQESSSSSGGGSSVHRSSSGRSHGGGGGKF